MNTTCAFYSQSNTPGRHPILEEGTVAGVCFNRNPIPFRLFDSLDWRLIIAEHIPFQHSLHLPTRSCFTRPLATGCLQDAEQWGRRTQSCSCRMGAQAHIVPLILAAFTSAWSTCPAAYATTRRQGTLCRLFYSEHVCTPSTQWLMLYLPLWDNYSVRTWTKSTVKDCLCSITPASWGIPVAQRCLQQMSRWAAAASFLLPVPGYLWISLNDFSVHIQILKFLISLVPFSRCTYSDSVVLNQCGSLLLL